MRKPVLTVACVFAVALCAILGARSQGDPAKVRLRVVDAATGQALSGIVRVLSAEKPLDLANLLPRLRGLQAPPGAEGWHVVPAAGAEVTLPRAALRFEAVSGLESELGKLELDLRARLPEEIVLKLGSVFRPDERSLVAGNTHLHLMKLSKAEAEDYLRQIPAADRLRVLFISYLERHKEDATYITNGYPTGDLPAATSPGALVNNGEEHRHNFASHGEGYGHVMFLGIKQLVKPVSLGPGITGAGVDDRPLRPGIDEARQQGGTIVWCHNAFGTEDVLNAISGRLHALNVFDGSRRGSFEENYYRYLNIGLPLAISTGTDWFLYDFARVYASVPGKLTIAAWLDALKSGRNQATNGPLLSLQVDGKDVGETLRFEGPKSVKIEASAVGRHDFTNLELVYNGKVVKTAAASGKPFQAKIAHELRLEGPGWLAARIESKTKNELGHVLFAHTSPVYVEMAGQRIFDVEAARAMLQEVEASEAVIRTQAKFSTPDAAAKLLALYAEGANDLRQRINQRGK